MKKKIAIFLLLLVSLAALAGLVWYTLRVSEGMSGNLSTSKFPVRIQEYMSSNTEYPDPNGVCTDWVELYNSSSADIDIGGFQLTDDSRKSRYTVPAGTVIPADGYYVIYCLRTGGEGYAAFGISRTGGEEILLLNRKNVLIDSVATIALPVNASAERDETGAFRVCKLPSPGFASRFGEEPEEITLSNLQDVPGPVILSEIIAGNTFYADENGLVTDIIELANVSDAAIDLGGWMLQDEIDGKRLLLPAGTVIAPHGFYLIHCARNAGNGFYADFALSRNGGELIMLYTPEGVLTDHVVTLATGRNEATARTDGETVRLSYTTPGFPNTEEGRRDCLASVTAGSAVRFNEVMLSNHSFIVHEGEATDWAELKNCSSAPADLSGFGLSDSASSVRYTFPEGTVLPAGGLLVIPCDGNAGRSPAAAHIGLSAAGGETLYLTRPDGTLAAAALTVAAGTDTSLVYDGILPAVSEQPTPGYEPGKAGSAVPEESSASSALVISEIMPRNACTLTSQDGTFADWVELCNTGSTPLSLGGFFLSDTESDPARFILPDVTLAPGGYALVFCSKEMTAAPGEIRAPFNLSGKGGAVYLTSSLGQVLETAVYPSAVKDRSYVREGEAEYAECDFPTPGFENSAAGYKAFLTSLHAPAGLYISEAMPSNRTVARVDGEYYDWVELTNGSDAAVRLSDYCLTDDAAAPGKCALPDVTLKSGDRIVVYCSGNAALTTSAAFHCPFRLSGGEDRLYLFDASGKLLDYLHIYKVPVEGSIGRQGRDGGICVFETPSPGKANSGGTEALMLSTMPVADKASGIYQDTEGFFVALSAPGTIRYTTDGSKPTASSPVWKGPLKITKTSVVRAVCFEQDKRPSDVLTLAYTVNEGHTLPVLNLVLAPDDLMGSKRGIYANPKELWQRQACIVYTDANGTVTHDCGVRISGQHSRTRPQKSFKLIFSEQYGGRLRYDIFGDTCEQKTFPQLLIRAGIDSKYGIYREPLIQHMALPYRDTTFVQDSVPCVLYINGAYYGIYQFMESLSEETLADRIGVTTDSVTMFKGYLYPEHADLEIYQLLQYVKTHDMKKSQNYEYVKEHLALEDLIDWAIFQGYCHNADVSANVRYFKSSETDGRWHFVFYDVECGFKVAASFDIVFTAGQTAEFLTPLIKNSEFRDMFLQRLAYHSKDTFTQDKVLALLYEYDNAVREETQRHFTRWDLVPKTYIYNFNKMEKLLKADRVKQLQQSAKKILKLSDAEYKRYFGG